ncbi:helix-turn-helix transcriptional regulator [Haloechinothrix salitolerans]|uniref:Helix-turn-helix domain-containing protein n=2 Tax=Haloechinothrix salitolerans TaxID=926830 RepID=A0ABW2C0E6_9PSEU
MTESSNSLTLGSYLRTQREACDMTIRQVARLSGIQPSYIAELEAGKKANPSAEILQKIASVLELDTADLFAFIGVTPPKDLPSVAPYLRAKYNLTGDALAEAEQQIKRIIDKNT